MATVCKITLDAEEYKKQLTEVMEQTRTVSAAVTAERPKIEVETEGASEKLNSLRESVRNLPEKKTITVKIQTKSDGKGFDESFKNFRKELNDTGASAGKLAKQFIGGAGALGLIAAGIASLGKIAAHIWDQCMLQPSRDASEMAQQNARSITETREAFDSAKQKADGYVQKLSELASAENLSNAETTQAIDLINRLKVQYGDLGIAVDATTGKITGLLAAQVKMAQINQQRGVRSKQQELAQLQADLEAQKNLMNNSGFATGMSWNGKKIRLGGEADSKAAAQKIEEITAKINKLRREMKEAGNENPVKGILAAAAASNRTLAETNQQTVIDQAHGREDYKFSTETDFDNKVWNRQNELVRRQMATSRAQSRMDDASRKMSAIDPEKSDADKARYLELEKQKLEAEREYLASKNEEEKLERQIADLKRSNMQAVAQMTNQAKQEAELAKMAADGRRDAVHAAKLEYEIARQHLKVTQAQKDAILDYQKATRTANLKKSLRDEAVGLYDKALRANGQGKQADYDAAMRKATELNGGVLSQDQIDHLKKLVELKNQLENLPKASFGNLSIQTNSLTARGGFAGGALAPDKDKWNRMIHEQSKVTTTILGNILTEMKDINKL